MKKLTYNLLIQPSNQDYYDLLDYALAECKYAIVVIRDTVQLSPNGQGVLEKLSKHVYKENQIDEWPGTKLLNSHASVVTYHYVPEVVEILKTTVPNLYKWLQPDLPEDLCLLRVDETPWMVTISHEKDGYFVLSELEQDHLIRALPQYRFMLAKQI
jgi:hypothetical protein